MKKILIIGGGFAGLSAAVQLSKRERDFEVILIDKRRESVFLPMLPDVIGKRVKPEFLLFSLQDLSKKLGFEFINDEITAINLKKRELYSLTKTFGYDYLIIASGSETNFYGNEHIKKIAYKLDDAEDAKMISQALSEDRFDSYIVIGGGYTGIEVASNLRLYLDRRARNKRIIIVERAPSLLGPLPLWMKDYASWNLRNLRIEIYLGCVIERIEEARVWLSNNKNLDNAMLIWAAGVEINSFVNNLEAEKTPQKRIKVNEYLSIDDNCFVLGDAANFIHRGKPLRMAVQFSISQGRCAANNLVYRLHGLRLKKYKPLDLGYIIPMANNKSCGRVLGINLKGRLATVLHYLMCIYRSYGLRNKMGILKCLIKGGGL